MRLALPLCAGTLALLGGCGSPAERPAAATWLVYRNAGADMSARYPAGWHPATRAISGVISPKQRIAIATFPLEPYELGPGPIADLPPELPRGAALVYVEEASGHPTGFAPRPARFALHPISGDVLSCEVGRVWPGVRFHYRQAGRPFYASIALGRGASRRTRSQALAILNSVRVGHRPTDFPEPTP